MLVALNENQKVVLDAYCERYVIDPLESFIGAVKSDIGKAKRLTIISYATELDPPCFQDLLKIFYPVPNIAVSSDTGLLMLYNQKIYFQNVLRDINLFCKGQPDVLRHPLYEHTFAENISYNDCAPADRKALVSKFLCDKINSLLKEHSFDEQNTRFPEINKAYQEILNEIIKAPKDPQPQSKFQVKF